MDTTATPKATPGDGLKSLLGLLSGAARRNAEPAPQAQVDPTPQLAFLIAQCMNNTSNPDLFAAGLTKLCNAVSTIQESMKPGE